MTDETSNNKMYIVLVVLAIAVALMAAVTYAGSVTSLEQKGEHTFPFKMQARLKRALCE
jgi:hypothetical protein